MGPMGGVEAGGTKFVCAVGTNPDDLIAEVTFPTTSPQESVERAAAFFESHGGVSAIGVGSFGPLDIDPESPTWGHITTTPKPGWAQANLAGALRERLGVPVAIDTDVNAAAMGEGRWGAAQGLRNFVYLTIGTGIGGGAVVEGALLHGMMHPEMGHLRTPHDMEADPFPGICPYHGDCLEGLACGPAIEARWGAPPQSLTPDHPAWDLESRYLALALADIMMILSPERIILGGGVMQQTQLFSLIRSKLEAQLGGYLSIPAVAHSMDTYIVLPGLGGRAGVLGAIALAEHALAAP
jgi:fructokinase